MERKNAVKGVLWLLTGMALVLAVSRFSRGLGATTNLSDSQPWGFWISFDVISGVALAAGGFVMAAIVYIFRIEKFKGFVRAAVLTAFLGYIAVAIGLAFDLGLPWNIWHPMIYWQYRSVLFEVAMCVMLYLTVLGLEFAPVALEHKLARYRILQTIYRVLKTLTIPLVILGIMLSTLHQSSLGSLFVIMPYRVHPLWYSPGLMLPIQFFVSAVALGFMMVILEHYISAWIYKHKPRTDLLASLSIPAAGFILLYGAFRVGDLMSRGILPGAIDGSWQSWLFIFELLVSVGVPVLIVALPKLRKSGSGLFTAALFTVLGMILYRINISLVTMARWPGTSYFPSMVEIMVSVGIIAGLALVFMYFVENLQVFEETMKQGEPRELETAEEVLARTEEGRRPPRGVVTGTVSRFMERWFLNWEPFQKPKFFATTRTWFGNPLHDGIRRYSMLLVVAVAVTAAILPENAIFGFKYEPTPVAPARVQISDQGEMLLIDGNRNGEFVLMNHDTHKERNGGMDGCVNCHHMNFPDSQATACAACHADMFLPSSAFDHDRHQRHHDGNKGCILCHPKDKNPDNAKSCAACHQEMFPGVAETERVNFMASSYQDAMHGLCETCHQEQAVERNQPELGLCSQCHPALE